MESLIDQFFAFLNGYQQELTLRVSLMDIKTKLAEGQGYQAFMQILDAQPPCSFMDLGDLFFGALFQDLNSLPSCRPPDALLSEFEPVIRMALTEVVNLLPDEFDLDPLVIEFIPSETLNGLPGALKLVQVAMVISPLLPIFIFVMIALLGARSWRSWFFWWGIPLFASGLALLFLAFVTPPLANPLVRTVFFRSGSASLSSSFELVLIEVSGHLVQSLATRVAVTALVIAAIGGILLGVWAILKLMDRGRG
jgi:hypothetical protein